MFFKQAEANRMRKWVIVGIVLPLLAASATPALAQSQPSQPFRGLFGADPIGSQPPQSLDYTVSLFGVEDNNLPQLRGRRSLEDGTRDDFIYLSDLRAGLWYTRRGRRMTLAASGASALQHYPRLENTIRSSHAGMVGITATTLRSSFSAEQQVRYSPYHRFRVVPVPRGAGPANVEAPEAAFAVSGRRSYLYNTALAYAHRTTSRSSLNLEYRHEYIDFVEGADLDWRIQDARIGWNRDLNRTTSLLVGYGYHRRDLDRAPKPLVRHDVNIGVNYHSALVFSPRTTFSFSVASAVISNYRESKAISTETTFLRLLGQTELAHQLSATWRAAVSYERGLQYVEGVSDVFFADSVIGSIGGYLGPRVDARVSTGYSTGHLRLSAIPRGYDTYASTGRLRIALSRNFAAQTEYVHYRYLFSDAVTLPTGIPARQNRQVFSVGLTTWFPLLP